MKRTNWITILLLSSTALVCAENPQEPGADKEATAPVELKTDYRVNPLGVEPFPPRLSWRMGGEGLQTAFRIQSAASLDALLADRAGWDSGRRESPSAWQVPYGAPQPGAGERIWWRVKTWDADGVESDWSEPAFFETGISGDPRWEEAPWIGCDRDLDAPEPVPADVMGDWIRAAEETPFDGVFIDVDLPDKPVVSAMAYWSRTGEPGGKPVWSAVVANFERTVGIQRGPLNRIMNPSRTGFCDLAFFLRPGESNRIELRFRAPVREVTAAIGMRVVFADGEERVVRSGSDWKFSPAGSAEEGRNVERVGVHGRPPHGEVSMFPRNSLAPAWFRGVLPVVDEVRRARLYLCALGQGDAYVNGRAVSDRLFEAPQTDYEAFAFYSTYDITELLERGDNALAVRLDAGWYHEVGGFKTVFSYGRPGLKALALIEYADGREQTFVTGPDWQWKEGAIRESNIYRGETIDYRMAHEEWKSPRAGEGWKPARELEPRTPETRAMDVLPVKRGREFQPVKHWRIGENTWLFDFGEVLFGWVRFTMEEAEGTTVRLRYTESARDGVLENVPISQWWCHGVTQGDTAIADGTRRLFEPAFTPKSFRYVEISGIAAPPDDLTAVQTRSTARPLASFESSDPMLNRLFENGMRTWANYVGHMVADIPRERCLWGAESIYCEIPGSYSYDFVTNHRFMHELWGTGRMAPDGIPGNIGVGMRLTEVAHDFTWSATPLYMAHHLYEHYGDLEPARRHYAQMKHFLAHFENEEHSTAGVFPKADKHSDHAPPKDIERNPQNRPLITGLHFMEAQNRFADLAEALGRTDDAEHARRYAEKIRRAIVSEYYDEVAHTFGNGTQDSLALAYGAIREPAERERLAASLVGWYRNNGHRFDGGFLSHQIYPQLSHFGYADDAVKMLTNTEAPGPAWSIKHHGATTFWEAYYNDWEFQKNRGLNFIAWTHSIGWMLTDLAGIRCSMPAGERMRLSFSPQFPASLDHVSAMVETPSGSVASAWKREDGGIVWNVAVPWNTTATVDFPDGNTREVGSGEHQFTMDSQGIPE